jgi:DNA-binding Xre family transcriptional regulator
VLVVTRQVIALIPGGSRIVAEGSTTEVKFERINDICGETPCVDNFCYHFDCQVVDDLEILVNGSGGSIYN